MKHRLVAFPAAAVMLAVLASGCSSTSSSTAAGSDSTTVESSAPAKTTVTDTTGLPSTIEAMATVAAVGNMLGTVMSTGGVVKTTPIEIVGVDGTGFEVKIPVPEGTVITINSTAVTATPTPLSPGTSVCVSIPDPSEPGQYVKMDVAGSHNMTFGNPELSVTPCSN